MIISVSGKQLDVYFALTPWVRLLLFGLGDKPPPAFCPVFTPLRYSVELVFALLSFFSRHFFPCFTPPVFVELALALSFPFFLIARGNTCQVDALTTEGVNFGVWYASLEFRASLPRDVCRFAPVYAKEAVMVRRAEGRLV